MAQQTDTQECQRPAAVLTALTDASEGDVRQLNDGKAGWELAAKRQPEGIVSRAVFYRVGVTPTAPDYDWRDDPRLIIEYVRPRYGPVRRPEYVIRQVGEGVIEEGDVNALRRPDCPTATWSALAAPDADGVVRLPVEHANGEAVVISLGDELIQHVVTDGSGIEHRRVTVTDIFYRDDAWRVEVAWGNDRNRATAAEVAAALQADDGGLDRTAPDAMPDDAMVWFPDLESDTHTTTK